MFYTLAAKLPVINNNSTFLKIFVLGSVLYILLHYYVHSGERMEFLEKIKSYLYYIMAIDLGIAFILYKFTQTSDHADDEKENDTESYTKKERDDIDRNIAELKQMNAQRQRIQEQQNRERLEEEKKRNSGEDIREVEGGSKKSNSSPFITRDEIDEEHDKKQSKKNDRKEHTPSEQSEKQSEKKSRGSESESKKQRPKEKEEKKDRKKETKKKNESNTNNTDTEDKLPVFMGK